MLLWLLIPLVLFVIIMIAVVIIIAIYCYHRCSKEVPILMYHRVTDIPGDRLSIPPNLFAAQLEYLQKKGHHTITLAQLHQYLTAGTTLPAKPVILTFDDAYDDNYTNALPLLQQYGMCGTVFAISQWVDADNGWEDFPGKRKFHTMNWEHLREWHNAGMEIGSHTRTHPLLTTLTDDEILNELIASKSELQERLGITVQFLAYPYGDCDARVKKLTSQAGYLGAVAIYDNAPLLRNDLYGLRRIMISSKNSLKDFAMKTSPWHILSIGLRQLERGIKRVLNG